MFDSTILEVAMGLTLIYLLLSLICSAINEWIARLVALRASNLEEGIRNLLNDPDGQGHAEALYAHPLIDAFARTGRFDSLMKRESKPTYIPSEFFARALLDLIAPSDPQTGPKSIAEVRAAITVIQNDSLRNALLPLVDEAGNDLAAFRLNIEKWYNHAMDRVSGWYKRKVQLIILALGMLLSIALNVDTLTVANALWRDSTLRGTIVAVAQETAREDPSSEQAGQTDPLTRAGELTRELQSLQLPIGSWNDPLRPQNDSQWLSKIVGLLLTGIAVSLGAPFWFDVLNKLVNVRATGDKPAEVPKTTVSLQAPLWFGAPTTPPTPTTPTNVSSGSTESPGTAA